MGIHQTLVEMQRSQENAMLLAFHNQLQQIVNEEVVWVAHVDEIIRAVADTMLPKQPRPTAMMWLAWDLPEPDVEMDHNASMDTRMRLGLYYAYCDFLDQYDQSSARDRHGNTLEVLKGALETRDVDLGSAIYDNGAGQYEVTRA